MTLELRHIVAGYGTTTVLRDVTVSLPAGAIVAVLGPNGAGKTTLLRVASGLLRATSGEVLVNGDDLGRRPTHEFARRGVCHIPEGRGIFRNLTVRENIILQAQAGQENDALEWVVDAFPVLGQRFSQTAGTMSGGEQQMLAVSRAYVSRAAFVLLDEVSLGLAPIVTDEIFAFMRRLAEQGQSLLLVEQYVVRAMELADYVYILNRGQVEFAGEPSELDESEIFRRYAGTDATVLEG